MRLLIGLTTALGLALTAPVAAQAPAFSLEPVAEGLDAPLYVTAPVGDPRLFVVEQTGGIVIVEDGQVGATPFLDLSGEVSSGGERGLLGLAFHPNYADNGRFFVNYTDREGDTQVVGYTVSDDPDVADAQSAEVLFSVEQPRGNHNGGWIGFGPDGLLYIGMGDGGGAGDPLEAGQDPDMLLGKMLRLDVDAGGDPEVFALGLRNPWRNAFDGEQLFIADVGQNQWEEINVVGIDEVGVNFGWNIMEGPDCYQAESCDQSGLALPVHAYDHDEGCSITGGYVYRGSEVPAIEGRYFFADFCSASVWSLRYADGEATDVVDHTEALGELGPVSSFGLDGMGEMYVTLHDGRLLRFAP